MTFIELSFKSEVILCITMINYIQRIIFQILTKQDLVWLDIALKLLICGIIWKIVILHLNFEYSFKASSTGCLLEFQGTWYLNLSCQNALQCAWGVCFSEKMELKLSFFSEQCIQDYFRPQISAVGWINI